MKRAMIITVGSGPGVENAIAFTIKKHNPDLVMLFISTQTVATVEKVRQILGEKFANEKIFIRESGDINNVDSLFTSYSGWLEELFGLGYTPDEIVADFTSGTKPMSAALALAGITFKIDSLCYIFSDTRDPEYGRSENAGMTPFSITPNQVYSGQLIEMARNYINRYRFGTAFELLEGVIHPRFLSYKSWLQKVATAFDAWDKFLFGIARTLMDELREHPESKKIQADIIFTQYKKQTGRLLQQAELYQLAVRKTGESQPLSPNECFLLSVDLAADLVHNAGRRKEEGKFDDALARLYRALESVGQIAFLKATGFTTTRAPLDQLPEILKKEFSVHAENGKLTLGLFQTFTALRLLENKTGQLFMSRESHWRTLLGKRNFSILAHGLQPVKKEDVDAFLELIKGLLPGYEKEDWIRI